MGHRVSKERSKQVHTTRPSLVLIRRCRDAKPRFTPLKRAVVLTSSELSHPLFPPFPSLSRLVLSAYGVDIRMIVVPQMRSTV